MTYREKDKNGSVSLGEIQRRDQSKLYSKKAAQRNPGMEIQHKVSVCVKSGNKFYYFNLLEKSQRIVCRCVVVNTRCISRE